MAAGETDNAASAASTLHVWRFTGAVLDERTQLLEIGGTSVELERKPLEVLMHLLKHAGDVVTKDELLTAVWPGRILSESVLTKCVGRLREVLGDDGQSIIKTVHGYGYRLIAPVKTEVARAAAPAHFDFKPGDHPPLRPHWNLMHRLGTGGHGEAWLVRHDKTRECRVFKFALDEQSLSALKREITLFRLLRDSLHDRARIVTLLDWNLEQAPYFIEAEYAVGGSLTEWAAACGGAGSIPMPVRTEIVAQIAEALATVHSVGILHKDLKPSNVLVETSPTGGPIEAPRILLGDLGCGGILDTRRLEALGITRLGFTQTVNVLTTSTGTPLYFAPELIAGQPPTVQADIYALGVVLYQMVVGDLYRPMAAGWEREVQDELLRADIAAAAEGDPEHRLVHAGELARRLRTLDERRAQLATERKAEQQAATQKLAAERMQARRTALVVAFAAMAIGLVASTWLYFDARTARAQAEKNAAQAQTVADFLAKDMFSVVGSRPLRDLTVPELLDAASGVLAARMENQPEAAAQIHAALGNAFWKMERPADAERHLDQALTLFERLGDAGSETAVSSAGELILAQTAIGKSPATMSRFDSVLVEGRERLGPRHPQVLRLGLDIARRRFFLGEWRHSADDLRSLIEDAKSDAVANRELLGSAEQHLGRALASLGEFKASVAALRESESRLGTGPASLELGITHLFLGQSLLELENFGEAEAELSRALEIMRPWVVGENSAHLMSVQFFLGQLRLRQGRADESVAILEKVVAAAAALDWMRTADHTYEWRAWLARAYDGAGHKEMALPAMRQALEVSLGTLGPRHPMTQHIRLGLADILRRTSGPAAARTALAAVESQVLAGLGPDHPFLAEQRRVEGLIAFAEGRPQEARRNLAEAQRIYELRYGPAHAFSKRAAAELAQLS